MTMTKARPAHRFYLTQRLRENTYVGGHGFDGLFRCEYMGSAEFEFGAIPKSLARIRAGRIVTAELVLDRTVYFVGPAAGMAEKIADFEDWVTSGTWGKEPTFFYENFTEAADEWQRETVAWWSLNDDVAWTLDPEVATKLATGFRGDVRKARKGKRS